MWYEPNTLWSNKQRYVTILKVNCEKHPIKQISVNVDENWTTCEGNVHHIKDIIAHTYALEFSTPEHTLVVRDSSDAWQQWRMAAVVHGSRNVWKQWCMAVVVRDSTDTWQ